MRVEYVVRCDDSGRVRCSRPTHHTMHPPIISLTEWFQTPAGQYLLAWEREQFDLAVADFFGYNALQLGLAELPTLNTNRMPHRWLAMPEEAVSSPTSADAAQTSHSAGSAWPRVSLVTNAAALPFPAASLDLVVLPHTLELSADPHHVLREVERVLVPEGRVVISGLNPNSWWGWRQSYGHWADKLLPTQPDSSRLYLPEAGEFIGPGRMRDWLRLLSFEVESGRFGCYRPAVRTEKWLNRTAWMDRAGPRWWPILGAVYFVVAVKRVRGMRMLGPAWKPRRSTASAPVPVANRH